MAYLSLTLFCLSIITVSAAHAQSTWSSTGPNVHYNTGYVGLGTSYPLERLHLDGGFLPLLFNVGGSQSILRNAQWDPQQNRWEYVKSGSAHIIHFNGSSMMLRHADSGSPGGSVSWRTSLWMNPSGNVGIGTEPTSEKLAVGGKILAEEVIVQLQEDWPDYVFEEGYTLLSLQDLERYIQAHGHLPDVPSALEVKTSGLAVGTTQAALLKKIEELVLYTIDQEKRADNIEAHADELADRLDKQERLLDAQKILLERQERLLEEQRRLIDEQGCRIDQLLDSKYHGSGNSK